LLGSSGAPRGLVGEMNAPNTGTELMENARTRALPNLLPRSATTARGLLEGSSETPSR
jgi:hypothetical protein